MSLAVPILTVPLFMDSSEFLSKSTDVCVSAVSITEREDTELGLGLYENLCKRSHFVQIQG